MLLFRKKSQTVALMLSVVFVFSGLAYVLYLHAVFPSLVPHYGGGERFTLSHVNDYASQIPWSAFTRLHIALKANDTVQLYIDGKYTCDCTQYDLIIEAGDEAHILLKSDAPVVGMFTAWQDTPFEKQLVAYTLLVIGLIGVVLSTKILTSTR
jgi:hypothetical protein